ncbi:MAG: FHA domain-containing protein, partial [Planctomycetota bacterium]
MIRLTVRHQTQPDSEEIVEFDKDVISIGRHSENDVVLGERTVSRKHAQIEKEGEKYFIKDLDSHFGVFVNKRKIASEVLAPGGEIYITPFILKFDLVEGAAAAAPAPDGDFDVTLGPPIAGGPDGFQPGPPPESA